MLGRVFDSTSWEVRFRSATVEGIAGCQIGIKRNKELTND